MDQLLLNLRYAVRRMLRYRLSTSVILLCLTLGIGANTAIFSFIDNLLLRPLPVPRIERLVNALDMRDEFDPYMAAPLGYLALKEQARSFEALGFARPQTFNLTGGDLPERVEAATISPDYLTTLGIEPIHGRGFTAEDGRPGHNDVVLLGHGLWKRRFGGDPGQVGKTLLLENRAYQVVGILPEGFDLPLSTEIWVPAEMNIATLPLQDRALHNMIVVGRLKPGVSVAEARSEARTLASRLAETYPAERKGWAIHVIPLRQQLLGDITGQIRPALLLVVGIAGLLLLIACANVASLLLVRSLERSQEIAIQAALGAERRRLVGQLVTEGVLLSLLGGTAGLLLALWVTPALMAMSPVYALALKGYLLGSGPNLRIFGFALLVSLATGVLFALSPAVYTAAPSRVARQLREGSRRSGRGVSGRRLLAGLVVGEIAFSVVLLWSALLMVQSFRNLSALELGFETADRLTVEMFLPEAKYPEEPDRAAFVERLMEEVRHLPGIESAGATTNIPLAESSRDTAYTIEGQVPDDASEAPVAAFRVVSPEYLQTLGVRLLEGRLLSDQDREGTPVAAVVSRELVRRAWPGQSALGKRFRRGHPPADDAPWLTVVGVVEDVKEDRFNFRIDRPVLYVSFRQMFPRRLPVTVMVAADGDPARLAGPLQQAVWDVDPDMPVGAVQTLEVAVDRFLGPQRLSALMTGFFAVLGLVLATLGLYGMLTYSVRLRTEELGIRTALGAQSRDLMRLVLGEGLRLTIVGLVLGLAGGLVVGRWVGSILYQVRPGDPGLLALALLLLAGVALLAIWLPARQVLRADPVVALHAK